MLVTIKIHSAFKQLFKAREYTADFKTYGDIVFYLNGMHKSFTIYARKQKEQNIEESFVFLDKNLKIINPGELKLRHARDGDVIHIVPAVVGGGGKRGGLLAVLAVAAFAFIALPALAAVGTGAAAGAAGTGAAAGAAGTGLFGGSNLLSQLVINIGLAMLTSLFATKPSEQNTRQNDMFGSLTNTTSSGIPVALNYGMMRVAGQMVSGYVSSLTHGKTQNMTVYGEVYTTTSTSVEQQEERRSDFLEGFNSFT